MATQKERSIYAALASLPSFGPKSFHYLLQTQHSLEALWSMREGDLRQLIPQSRVLDEFLSARRTVNPERTLESIRKQGITCITIVDDIYPALLKSIHVPPAILYVRGSIPEGSMVAIVGSRRMTDYGKRVTEDIAHFLGSQAIHVVSGLALGIDGAAHRATLDVHGKTVGVLASGVDRPYPVAHERLAQEIIERGGAIVSEFPPGTQALKHHFPIRNRIIAGLCQATVVVEAAEKSGSLLTARSALEEGRDVFAVPGSMYSPLSAGPHFLIQMGAKLLQRPEEILLELGLTHEVQAQEARSVIPDSPEEAALLEVLTTDPLALDLIVERVEYDPAIVLSTLTLMEMKGRAKNIGGNLFVRR